MRNSKNGSTLIVIKWTKSVRREKPSFRLSYRWLTVERVPHKISCTQRKVLWKWWQFCFIVFPHLTGIEDSTDFLCVFCFILVGLRFFSRFALLQHHFYLTVFYSLGVYSFEWSCVFQTYKQERTTFWVAFHNRTLLFFSTESPLGIVFIMIQRDLNSSHFFNKQKEKKSRNIYCITFKRTSSLIQLMNVGNCSVSCFRVDFYFQ